MLRRTDRRRTDRQRSARRPGVPRPPLRVLVLTNHFRVYAGSELVALEVAEWFAARGDRVTIGTHDSGPPMSTAAAPMTIVTEIDDLSLGDFDLVWCQHDLLSFLPVEAFSVAARDGVVPLVAVASLGPSHPFEHLNAVLASALSAVVFAGTDKAATSITETSHGVLRSPVRVLNNAAPDAFWTDAPPPPRDLRRVLAISNHAPAELTDALAALTERGIEVRRIGAGSGEQVRITPDDLDAADAVVTIGKSVIYSIARRRPVYLYDHFGGDGWLVPANWAENRFHNFAGQPRRRRLESAAIADEIANGFPAALEALPDLRAMLGDDFRLGHHLGALRAFALTTSPRRRSLRLRAHLAVPHVRSMLETNRRKSLLVRRFFLAVAGAEPEELGTVRKWWWGPADAERLADYLESKARAEQTAEADATPSDEVAAGPAEVPRRRAD